MAVLLAATILLPLAAMALGVWERQRGDADWADLDAERLRLERAVDDLEARQPPDGRIDFTLQFRRGGQTFVGPLALAQAREARGEAAALARVMALRRLLPPAVVWASGAVVALSGLVLLAGAALGRLGRTSREVLVRGFALVRRALPVLLGLQVLLGATAFVAAVCFEAAALLQPGIGTGEVKMLMLAGVAILGSLYAAGVTVTGLRGALAAFEPDPLPILGRAVSPAEAPGLWRLVDGLADRLGALKPEAIVVGLTEGFFVSAGPKVLEPGGGALAGRALYVPLPYLPLLRLDELAAIIGHELAHFAGGDTAYSLRFLPIYAGVGRSLDAIAAARGSGFGLLGIPLRLGLFVMDRFHHAVRHWSRRREFAADAAGAGPATPDAAGPATPDAAARALLRVGAVEPRVAEALSAAAEDVARAPGDLVRAVFDHAAARGLDDPAAHLDAEQAHPTDSHPPTRERIVALGIPVTPERLAEAAAVPPREALGRLDVYFADPGAICRCATADFLAVAHRHHDAVQARIEAVAASVQPDEQTFTTNMRAAGWFVLAFGIPLLGTAILLLATGVPGTSPEQLRIVSLAGGALGAVFAGFGLVYLLQGSRVWLVLGPEGLALAGLDRTIGWDEVADLDMAWSNRQVTMRVLLPPAAPVPARRPGARRIRVDAARRIVVVKAVLSGRVGPQAFADLVFDYRHAARARQLLAERDGARRNPEPDLASPAAAAPTLPRLPTGADNWRQAAWALFGSLMAGAALVAAVVLAAPSLMSGWQVQGAARPLADAQVTDGRCSSQIVLQICDVTLAVPTAAGTVSRRTRFAFTGVHVGDRAVRVLADPARPDLATTDMALDRLWNRTITLLVGVIGLLAVTLLPLIALVRNRWRPARVPSISP